MRLVLAVHGTASVPGRNVYEALAARVAEHVPTALAHLDVQTPLLPDVVRPGDVVVPLLLARGYHVRVDCAAAVQQGAVVAPAVGPALPLVQLAQRRLQEAGAADDQPVVLGAAGSRDATALQDLRRAARRLQHLRGTEVALAFASRPRHVAATVEELQARSGRPVAVASWFLAPGRFATSTAAEADAAGALMTSAPLGDDDAVVTVVLQRWRSACAGVAAA